MNWHEKLLTTENCFHVAAFACLIRALLAPSPESAGFWLAAVPGISALGRSLPTEILDKKLAIPLDGSSKNHGETGK